jgi:hypothetical protein
MATRRPTPTTHIRFGVSAGGLAWLVLFLPAAAAGPQGTGPKGWRKFVSERGGYVAYYPKTWHTLGPPVPTLNIANFPFSKIVTAVTVPEHGAVIGIAPPPDGVKSIAEWAARDRAVTPALSERSFTLRAAGQTGPLHITEVVLTQVEGPGAIRWYFYLAGIRSSQA